MYFLFFFAAKATVTVNMNQSLYKISIPSAGGILVMLVNQSQTKKLGVLTEKTQVSEMKINRWLLIFLGELNLWFTPVLVNTL